MKHPHDHPKWMRCVVPNFSFQNTGEKYFLNQKDYKNLVNFIQEENYTSQFKGYNNCITSEFTDGVFNMIKYYPNLLELFVLSSNRWTITNAKNRNTLFKLIKHENTNLTLLFMKIGMENMLKFILPMFFENEKLVTNRVKEALEDFIEGIEDEYDYININFIVYSSVLCNKDLTGCLNKDNIDNSNYFIGNTFDRIQSLIPTKMMRALYDRLFDIEIIEGKEMFDFLWSYNGRVQYRTLKYIVDNNTNFKYLTYDNIKQFDEIVQKHPKTIEKASNILYKLNPTWIYLTKFVDEPDEII